jgi:hypothetical protein
LAGRAPQSASPGWCGPRAGVHRRLACLRDTRCDGHGGDATGLRARELPVLAEAFLVQILWNLQQAQRALTPSTRRVHRRVSRERCQALVQPEPPVRPSIHMCMCARVHACACMRARACVRMHACARVRARSGCPASASAAGSILRGYRMRGMGLNRLYRLYRRRVWQRLRGLP